MFAIDPVLTRSAAPFCELPLSTVLLKDDARWPWLLLGRALSARPSLAT